MFLGGLDRLATSGSSVDIRISQQFQHQPIGGRFVEGLALALLRSAHSGAFDYRFDGSTLDKSVVSLSGVEPASTPFFSNRNAMMSIEFLAETDPGADIGICVCTLDQRVETFLPP